MDKRGKLYFQLIIAAALLFAVVSANVALASAPTSTPFITNNNASLYQPQNRSLVGYWKLDGNANDVVKL